MNAETRFVKKNVLKNWESKPKDKNFNCCPQWDNLFIQITKGSDYNKEFTISS